MKKQWKLPKINNLEVSKTQEESIEPFFFWPGYPECSDPANTGEGYQKCTKKWRPCKYYGIPAGGCIAECNAPSAKKEETNS